MAFELPPLPYKIDDLAPYVSAETLEYHYGKHHRTYVNKLNTLIADSEWHHHSLEQLVKQATGGIFNNAAQVWNHTFYWQCMKPNGGGEPCGRLAEQIIQNFDNFSQFKKQFTDCALSQFGSGWAWLVRNQDGSLAITSTGNADNPLRHDQTPLLTCDVWEHAYYIDTRNDRARYLENFWQVVNWGFVADELEKASA